MIKVGLASLFITFMISGCSMHTPNMQKLNTYDLRVQHTNVVEAHKSSFNKMEENRISNTPLEVEHNALWYYGVDMNLNKDEIFIMESNNDSYFKFGFGFEKFIQSYTKDFFGDFNEDLIYSSKFNNFNELFNYVYLRMTKLNETEYISFISKLAQSNIIIVDEYLNLDIDKHIMNYFKDKYLNAQFYFYVSGGEYQYIAKENFIPYIYSMYIVSNILKTNNLEIIDDI